MASVLERLQDSIESDHLELPVSLRMEVEEYRMVGQQEAYGLQVTELELGVADRDSDQG